MLSCYRELVLSCLSSEVFFTLFFLILLLLNVVCLLFVVWPELLKCYSDIIMVNSSKCEYDVMISPLLFSCHVYVCVRDSSLGCTHPQFHCYFAVILHRFHQG